MVKRRFYNFIFYCVIFITRYLWPISIRKKFIIFKHRKVVVLGSGPSLNNVKLGKVDDYLLVAINGAVYSEVFLNFPGSKFCFTADGSRGDELFDFCKTNDIRMVISTHTIYHLSLKCILALKTVIFFLPAIKLNSLRLEFKSKTVEQFEEVGMFPVSAGFGSLSHFLQFVNQNVTEEIHLFGFDFSEEKGKYFQGSPDSMNRNVNFLEKSLSDYLVIRKILIDNKIVLFDGR